MGFHPDMAKNEHLKAAKDGLDVWGDIATFAAKGYASIPDDDFPRLRWYGIYQQKPNEGHFMWRIKLPGGRVTPQQAVELAKVADKFGRGIVDITTRQDVQFHWMTIEDFPEALDRVYNRAGLYVDFACGDTPRNVCSCTLDGMLPTEMFPLGNLVQKLSDLYKAAGKELSNLPRKFKTSISTCPLHCHQPQINDLSAFGVIREDGSRGLGVMVGGGLSSTPHFAQSLRVFVPQADVQRVIPDIWYHVCCIFRDADELRYKRKRARIKFLVADKGWQWVRDELERRLGYLLIHDESIINPRGAMHTDHVGVGDQLDPRVSPADPSATARLKYVGVPVSRGRLRAEQFAAIGELAARFAAGGVAGGLGEIRLSQKQNLVLMNIDPVGLPALLKELEQIGLPAVAPAWRRSLVSCTGGQFCNLAVVETKERSREILRHLEETVGIDVPFMLSISGCANACAQFQVADIGMTGTKVLYNGQKVDAFDILMGGQMGDVPRFGREVLEKVPSPVVHQVLERVTRAYMENRIVTIEGDKESFADFSERIDDAQFQAWAQVPPREVRAPTGADAAV